MYLHVSGYLLSSLSVNQFYPLLDEIGSWKGSSDQLCDSIHSLAAQADCVSGRLSATAANQARPECRKGERGGGREGERGEGGMGSTFHTVIKCRYA